MNGSEVSDILVFVSVVETGSFVAGGKMSGLSRSAAGKAVARLEDRFAMRLLNRTTRALSLTEEGRNLYDHGLTIRAALEAAEASITGDPGLPRGILRMTAPDAFGRRVMMPVVRQYLDMWPEIQIEISFSDRVANIIQEGFDLAIRIDVTSPDRNLVARTIMTDDAFLCAAPAYLASRGKPCNAEQLGNHDLLFFASHNERQTWRLQEPDGTLVRAQGKSRLRLDNGEAPRDAALAGAGIALLPGFLVSEDLRAGRLEHVLPGVTTGPVRIMALYPHKRHLEPRVRHFIDLLVKMLASPHTGGMVS